MKRMYIYPKVYQAENPYITELENALAPYYQVVNGKPNNWGVLDFFVYLFSAEIFYFNWIENIPSRKYGTAQIGFFLLFLFLAKISGKKIVWTLHNKYSHDKKGSRQVDLMYALMIRYADVIITHSSDGVDFIRSRGESFARKVYYFIHPVKPLFAFEEVQPEYDVFIWGTIWPYKGVSDFLSFLKRSGNNSCKVLIAGRCINKAMQEELGQYLGRGIQYMDEFFTLDDIARLSKKARYTLFTYKPDSILSSGSLMDSIAMGASVIGPNVGAFKDLSSYGFLNTYETYDDIITILNANLPRKNSIHEQIKEFCKQNSWQTFGKNLSSVFLSHHF